MRDNPRGKKPPVSRSNCDCSLEPSSLVFTLCRSTQFSLRFTSSLPAGRPRPSTLADVLLGPPPVEIICFRGSSLWCYCSSTRAPGQRAGAKKATGKQRPPADCFWLLRPSGRVPISCRPLVPLLLLCYSSPCAIVDYFLLALVLLASSPCCSRLTKNEQNEGQKTAEYPLKCFLPTSIRFPPHARAPIILGSQLWAPFCGFYYYFSNWRPTSACHFAPHT